MEIARPLFSKTDKSFSEENLLQYDLVFQVTERSCSWSVFDHENTRYIGLESYDIPLHRLAEQVNWIKKPAKSVVFIIENNRSTLIPVTLFEDSAKETYLNFSVEQQEEEKVLVDRLTTLDIVNIYGINDLLLDYLTMIFPRAKICHISSLLIEGIWMNFKNLINDKRIFIFVRDEAFNMLIFEKKQLVFSNAFNVRAPEDFVYYVMFVMEQFNLNPEEIPVTLLGNIDKKTPDFELLFRYVRNVDFAMRNESVSYSYVFDNVPGHAFFTLLNPVLCGS
jgi:hypothetical protein